MSDNGRKARYGLAYLQTICGQAGVTFNETKPDEDVMAIDAFVHFAEATVRVQVKCTSQFKIAGRSASWDVEDHWLRAWNKNINPVYFVLVIVPDDSSSWLTHETSGTMHHTAAFWVRLKPGEIGSKIKLDKTQRLTELTIAEWHGDLLSMYTPGGINE